MALPTFWRQMIVITVSFAIAITVYVVLHPDVRQLLYTTNYGRSSELKLSQPGSDSEASKNTATEVHRVSAHKTNNRRGDNVKFITNTTSIESIISDLDPTADAVSLANRVREVTTHVIREFNSSHVYFQPAPPYDPEYLTPPSTTNRKISADFWDSIDISTKDRRRVKRVIEELQMKKTTNIDEPFGPTEGKANFEYFHKTEDFASISGGEKGDPFTFANISNAMSLTKSLLSLIYNRYELSSPEGRQYFLLANNIPNSTWEVLKYKFAKKIVKSALLNQKSDYVMVFAGSDLTAGSGNYFNDSYPIIVQKRLGPLLAALGITLRVRNIAQGDNSCNPYNLCIQSMGGADPDWIGWEQSIDCGRDNAYLELAARWAGYSKERAVIYFSSSMSWIPTSCPKTRESIPFSSQFWTEKSAGLATWDPKYDDLAKIKGLLNTYFSASSSAGAFMNWTHDSKYIASVSPHGFNEFQKSSKCDKFDGSKGCTAYDLAKDCKLKFFSFEASEFSVTHTKRGASRAMHLLRGEAISWLLALTYLDALHSIENELKRDLSVRKSLLQKYENKLDELLPKMPSASKCVEFRCDKMPICYTNYLPHYSSNMTLDQIILPDTNWTYYTIEPEGNYKSLAYHKPGFYHNSESDGVLRLKITSGPVYNVWLCGANKKALKDAEFYLDVEVLLYDIHQVYELTENSVKWTKFKFAKTMNCLDFYDLPKGEHILTIVPRPSNSSLSLTHVIMWL